MRTSWVVLCAALAAAVLIVRWRPIPDAAVYLGSESCAACHGEIYDAWSTSEHTKMMRPADRPGVVVAPFEADDPGRRFERSEVVWAIGGKWEQQFMGHDGKGETLLPGAWLHLASHWDFQGWDGWEVPIPRRRCHGCHTVGLEPETGRFVETNIGCESCHGPGSWHVRTLGMGQIHSSADAQVCGQCHTRGTSPSGEYFFPIGYRPGRNLDDHFTEAEPSPGQNSSYWWGNGRPRQRHQEYPAWRRGGHAHSLRSLLDDYDGRFGEVASDCLRCHAGDAALETTSTSDPGALTHGITCSVCHNVHGALTTPRIGCEGCHEGGAFYHTPERNARHVPCPPDAEVGCVDCHMPVSVSVGGALALHDHSPGIVPPEDTLGWSTPSSCSTGGCHAAVSTAELVTRFHAFYRTEGASAKFEP